MNTKFQLKTGKWIMQHNQYETEFVHHEIFVEEVYLKQGIKLTDDAVIIDAGANIGLFSLYVKENFPAASVYAIEPSPLIYPILKNNLAGYERVNSLQIGLAADNKMQTFYCYPGYSVISGFMVDQQKDAEVILTGMKASDTSGDYDESLAKNLVNKRLDQVQSYTCKCLTLSAVIQAEQISKVDLLKVDVEGSELAVLQGIAESDWHKIKQIVLEVHQENTLNKILPLLKKHFKQVAVCEDVFLKEVGIYNVYAR